MSIDTPDELDLDELEMLREIVWPVPTNGLAEDFEDQMVKLLRIRRWITAQIEAKQ